MKGDQEFFRVLPVYLLFSAHISARKEENLAKIFI